MSGFGARLYGPPGRPLPAFSEGAMWAFAAAVTITVRRDPGRPVWHLRAGIAVFAAIGAALNFLHGLTMARPCSRSAVRSADRRGDGRRERCRGDRPPAHHRRTRPQHRPAAPAPAAPTDAPRPPSRTAPRTLPRPLGRTRHRHQRGPPARTKRGQSTAARVAALKAKHPDMPAADIAARLKVSDRTVRRYLSPARRRAATPRGLKPPQPERKEKPKCPARSKRSGTPTPA